jgi:hypothetical protein
MERFNRILVNMLLIYMNTHQKDWNIYLFYVLYAYINVYVSTKEIPYFLMYERNVKIPS